MYSGNYLDNKTGQIKKAYLLGIFVKKKVTCFQLKLMIQLEVFKRPLLLYLGLPSSQISSILSQSSLICIFSVTGHNLALLNHLSNNFSFNSYPQRVCINFRRTTN